jgi:hypothetical protein
MWLKNVVTTFKLHKETKTRESLFSDKIENLQSSLDFQSLVITMSRKQRCGWIEFDIWKLIFEWQIANRYFPTSINNFFLSDYLTNYIENTRRHWIHFISCLEIKMFFLSPLKRKHFYSLHRLER